MSRSTYDFWLLDLDGTVVDVETSYIYDTIETVGDRMGISFSGHESELLWYGLGQTRDRILSDAGVDPAEFWTVFHDVEEPERRAAATHLYPDAEEFILNTETDIGVVTHCQEYLTGPVLDELDITDWFETVVCCTDETGWKPDPRPVTMAMEQLGVADNGKTGALVGDNGQDIGAAWNAGLDGIHVRRHDPDQFGQCICGDRRVDALTELHS